MTRITCTSVVASFAALIAVSVALLGCDKPQARKPIVLAPTTHKAPIATAPVVQTPATSPASTQAARKTSVIQIGQMVAEFPEAKLIVRKDGDKLSAVIRSNDPLEVINPTYQGNRYYFEMTLDSISDIKDIAQADFVYKAASADPQETLNGIFLYGDRQHLRPYDIRVVFIRQGDHLIADLRGSFIDNSGQAVPVMAQLAAKPEKK
jgi:hypothetical protein